MSINERVKYRIANVWDDQAKKFNQDQFDFEDRGKYAIGKFNWSTQKKNKQGKVSFTPSSLRFICFGEVKDLIANNLGAKFHIDASLCNESFTGKDGKKISFWQLTVFKAEIAEQGIDSHNQAKQNGYQPEDDFISDDCPF